MAKVAVPVVWLKYEPQDAFPNEIHEVFQGEGVWNPIEDFTFTGRVSLTKHGRSADEAEAVEATRSRIRMNLEKTIQDPEKYKSLLALLDENDWDVSFFVDCW